MKAESIDSDPAAPAGYQAAAAVCRREARRFYTASAALPQRKRDAACAVYAFCRMIEDAVALAPASGGGGCPGGDSMEARLELLGRRIGEVYSGTLDLPPPEARTGPEQVLDAVARTVRRFEIPESYFREFAEGCRLDRTIRRYATWAALERHCYQVAGVIGLMMCCVLGLTHGDAQIQAVQMATAMRLTSILRDIGRDRERGRIYLPLEDLARFGYSERDLAAGTLNDRFRELMRFEIARARQLYEQAAAGLCRLPDDGSRLAAAMAATRHSGILRRLERVDFDVFGASKEGEGLGEKLRRVAGAWRLSRLREGQPVPRRVFR